MPENLAEDLRKQLTPILERYKATWTISGDTFVRLDRFRLRLTHELPAKVEQFLQSLEARRHRS